MSEVKKVVLAYSDGLDTSIIIPWLKEHYNNCEVIAVCGNVGQKGELEGLEERAKASGALSTFYGPVQIIFQTGLLYLFDFLFLINTS